MKKNLKTPTKRVGKSRHGFLRRMKTKKGQQILKARRQKGRHKLSV